MVLMNTTPVAPSAEQPQTLVLGSRNKKKLAELIALLGDLPLTLSDLSPFANAPEVDETGDSFEANARLKAALLAPVLSTWVLGEDSGLCVPALGGAPGIYSARYAGTHGDDAANNAKLLDAMARLEGDDRRAYYVSTAALANPAGEIVAVVEGRCWGRIERDRRGCGGFGYDPLFLIPEYHATFGELTATVKQALSHRARAIAQLRPRLRTAMGI
jgi:XTP/dITP diphosphohydrolase